MGWRYALASFIVTLSVLVSINFLKGYHATFFPGVPIQNEVIRWAYQVFLVGCNLSIAWYLIDVPKRVVVTRSGLVRWESVVWTHVHRVSDVREVVGVKSSSGTVRVLIDGLWKPYSIPRAMPRFDEFVDVLTRVNPKIKVWGY